MDEAADRFRQALVAGFGPYVRARAGVAGAGGDGLDAAIDAGRSILERELEALFAAEAAAQSATPIQVFRAALGPVYGWLLDRSHPSDEPGTQQDDGPEDDPFGIAPASAAEISPEALEASLEWGAGKAAALRRPLAVQVGSNLMDATRFEAAAVSSGYRFERWTDLGSDRIPAVAFVDLEAEGADDAIRVLADRGSRVVAYGPHVDDMALVRARSLGAAIAEPRSRALRDPAAFLPPLV
jgi:hypothetical protein